MTCSKLDDSAINGSGYAVTTVRLVRSADIVKSIMFESMRSRSASKATQLSPKHYLL